MQLKFVNFLDFLSWPKNWAIFHIFALLTPQNIEK